MKLRLCPEAGRWQPSAEMLRVRGVVAEVFGVEEAALASPSRIIANVLARQATCFVLRTIWPTLSYPSIAVITGLGDHSTALYSVRKMAERMDADPALARQVESVISIMTARRSPRNHNAHVLDWQHRQISQLAERAAERRSEAERERELLALASQVARSDSVYAEIVARGVSVVNAARKVRPANVLVDDDADALRRKNASDGLSQAIAAAGGWR